MHRFALVILAVLAPLGAFAESIEFEANPKVLSGTRERPSITVHSVDDSDDVVVRLQRDDGKAYQFRTGRFPGGSRKRFDLDIPPGREFGFTGSIERRAGRNMESMSVKFTAEIIVPAKIEALQEETDIAARTLVLTSTRKCSKVEVEVYSDIGRKIGSATIPFDNVAPKTPLKVTWDQDEGTVMRIAVRVWDTDNFYEGVELFPWKISIPHEEVNFASGSFKVELKEEPKLASSLVEIQDAIEKYGRFAEIKLFIAGHTDTVGNADSNRTLSLNRARSISEYFRRHGLRVPILFEGFGEDALKVSTPDETDEIQNRRAEYIVAIEPPVISQKRAASWKALR